MCGRKKGIRVITEGENGVERGLFKDGRYNSMFVGCGNDRKALIRPGMQRGELPRQNLEWVRESQ